MVLIPFETLKTFTSGIFAAAGCSETEAVLVAEGLAESNLVGHDSHGVLRVPSYLAHLGDGTVLANRVPEVVGDTGTILTLDGGRGFGQVAGPIAVAHGISRARKHGLALVAMRNVGHVGRVGLWAEQTAEAGLVSLHFVNTSGGAKAGVLLAAPFGGRDRRMSINPICIGLPRAAGAPIIMDATIAATAGGKVMAALNRGDTLPPGQIIDLNGHPSTTPTDLFDGGSVLPFGDHRGYALSFMIDVLAGALTGGGCSGQERHPRMNNMASVFIDPSTVAGASFGEDLEAFSRWMLEAPPARAGDQVLLPGDIERSTAARRRAEGIPLDETTIDQLDNCAVTLGLSPLHL